MKNLSSDSLADLRGIALISLGKMDDSGDQGRIFAPVPRNFQKSLDKWRICGIINPVSST